MDGNFKDLENGLKVSIDWLSFTITKLSCVGDVLSLLGYSREDFNEMPRGRYGYKSMLSSMDIRFLFSMMEMTIWEFMLMFLELPSLR